MSLQLMLGVAKREKHTSQLMKCVDATGLCVMWI